jgi:hypothetical protein
VRKALVLLLVALLAGCGGGDGAEQQAAAPDDDVRELANVLQLRSDFEADAGKARVLLLLSPT